MVKMNWYVVVFYLLWRYVWEEQFSIVRLFSNVLRLICHHHCNVWHWVNLVTYSLIEGILNTGQFFLRLRLFQVSVFDKNLKWSNIPWKSSSGIMFLPSQHKNCSYRNAAHQKWEKKTCLFNEKTCWHMKDDEAYAVYFKVQKVEDKSWLFFALTSYPQHCITKDNLEWKLWETPVILLYSTCWDKKTLFPWMFSWHR